MGWSGVKNGELLALAARSFDAFITVDKNMPFQQNLSALPVALIVLDAFSNELHALLPLVSRLESELTTLYPRAMSSCASKANPPVNRTRRKRKFTIASRWRRAGYRGR